MSADPLAALLALDGVADAEAEARAAVDRLLAHRVLRRRAPEVSAESALRGAWASAVLAGADAVLADVRAGSLTDPVLQGALRAQTAVGPLAQTWHRAPPQALARVHALAAADLVAPQELGRPAARPGVAERLNGLAAVLTTTTAPATVLAAVVHGEVLVLDAFPPVSGIVARAAARMTLIDRGLDPKSLAAVEVGHLELRADYDRALTGYGGGTPGGLTEWLVHCAHALAAGARESLAICEALARG